MKIAVVGGHMAPALGFILALPKEAEVIYLGRMHPFEGDPGTSLEYQTITKHNIRFLELKTGRLQRSFTSHTLPSLAKIPRGFAQAFSLLKKERPDIVVGFGGYLSVPIGIAAKFLNIPLVIHESTLRAGLANKMLAPLATKICISWDSSRAYFPAEKIVITGNPMLPLTTKGVDEILPKSTEKLPLLCVVGGSGGSHAINKLIHDSLLTLLDEYRIIHQTGDAKEFRDFDKLSALRNSLHKSLRDRYALTKYIDPEKINTIFTKSDLIISRAGFNSVTAFLVLHKKTLLIPLPQGQKNEQLTNAQLLESEGLGINLNQKTLTAEKLVEEIHSALSKKQIAAVHWQVPVIADGAKNVVSTVLSCLPKHRHEE